MKRSIITAVFCAVGTLAPTMSQARSENLINNLLCAPAKQMRQKLERQFGAIQAGQGIQSPDQIMELWKEPRGDWTLVISYATGTSCIVAMGQHWDSIQLDTKG